jgi:hypothetical protein
MKTKKIYLLAALVLIIAVFSKCTMQKRTYRSGYYVSWNKKANIISEFARKTEIKKEKPKEEIVFEPIAKKDNEIQKLLLASVNKHENNVLKRSTIKPLKLINDSCGDRIILRNADEVDAKILEIDKYFVRYKRCDNLTGPMVIAKSEDVFMIKYANGIKEVFEKSATEKTGTEKQIVKEVLPPAEYNNFAIASVATAILGLTIILAPIPFVLGIIGSNQIKKDPQKYKGKGMAGIGLTFGAIGTILLMMIIFFAI